jgi:hypothetical protein
VILNGERTLGQVDKSSHGAAGDPGENVTRIEILDAAQVDVPGLTGQVANVVYEASTLSGQFSYQPEFRAHYADPRYTRGDVSVSGTKGPVEYTVSLQNQASRGAAGGPTSIRTGAGDLIEQREDVLTSNFDQPTLSGQFKLDGPGSSLGNLNLLYRRVYFRFEERSERDRVSTADQLRLVSQREDGYNYEIGGDYEVALLGGRLKFIGLNRYSDRPFLANRADEFRRRCSGRRQPLCSGRGLQGAYRPRRISLEDWQDRLAAFRRGGLQQPRQRIEPVHPRHRWRIRPDSLSGWHREGERGPL